MEMTYHCEVHRHNRVQHIIEEIGMGQIVKEKYTRTAEELRENKPGRYTCVTDTGIIIIKDERKEKIITIYVATARELVKIYGGQKSIPVYLQKRVDRNQIKYIKNGKTIW